MNTTISNIEIISEKQKWDQILFRIGCYDFYHTYDYHKLSVNSNEKPVLIVYTRDEEIIAFPLLIRKIFDTIYFDATSVYGYAGPLATKQIDAMDLANFREGIQDFFIQNRIVSVFSRLNPFISMQETVLSGIGEISTLSQIVTLDLTKSIADQRAQFSKTTKRYINKTKKLCRVEKAKSRAEILKFKSLYYENMDRVKAKSSYYFEEAYFFDCVQSTDFNAEVLLAVHNETDEVIAAAMMVKTLDIVQYHISGTSNTYRHLTPIRLLIDHVRVEATQQGFRYFNLGGGLGSKSDSLFEFKASFSKHFLDFKVWRHIVDQELYEALTLRYATAQESNSFFPSYRSLSNS